MKTVREVMNSNVQCVNEHTSVQMAAEKMRDLDVGVLPICGDDQKLKGVVTDRDIVVRCLANGDDPAQMEVGALAQGRPIMVEVTDSVDSALAAMSEHQVRRVLVLEDRSLVGIVTQRDLGAALEPARLGQVSAAVTGEGDSSSLFEGRGDSSQAPTPAAMPARAQQQQQAPQQGQQGLAGY